MYLYPLKNELKVHEFNVHVAVREGLRLSIGEGEFESRHGRHFIAGTSLGRLIGLISQRIVSSSLTPATKYLGSLERDTNL